MCQTEFGQPPVAVVGVTRRQVPPRRTKLPVVIGDGLRIAIDVAREAHAQLRAQPEKIEVLELDAAGVLATLAAERESGIERPDILRGDFDVDDAVAVSHGPD